MSSEERQRVGEVARPLGRGASVLETVEPTVFSGSPIQSLPVLPETSRASMTSSETAESFKKKVLEIQKDYGLEDAVAKWLTDEQSGLGATKMQDILKMVSEEAEVSELVDDMKDVKNKIQQRSRLKQAWSGLNKAVEDEENIRKRRADDVDMDELLTSQELETLADVYWARYHMTWQPEIMPADSTISRAAKKLGKRSLQVPEIWKVKM